MREVDRVASPTIMPEGLDEWRSTSRGHRRRRLPAPETARANDWVGRDTWVNSETWKHPRMIRLVRKGLVHLTLRTAQYYHGGTNAVKSFPADVHEVPAP